MGGKALNKYGVHTERKNTEEFLKIGNELQEQILKDLLLLLDRCTNRRHRCILGVLYETGSQCEVVHLQ